MVRLEAAAAADVAHAERVRLARKVGGLAARALARLERKGELGQVDDPLPARVGGEVAERLAHEKGPPRVGRVPGRLERLLHQAHGAQRDERVKVAADADQVGALLGELHRARAGAVAVHVALGADAHTRGDERFRTRLGLVGRLGRLPLQSRLLEHVDCKAALL